MSKTFTITKLGFPTRVLEFANDSLSATDAMALAGYASDGYEVRINGAQAAPSSPVNPGDHVTAVPKLKAGLR